MGAAASAADTVSARPNGPLLKDVDGWSVDEVCDHLAARGLQQYAAAVVGGGVDGAALLRRFHDGAALGAPPAPAGPGDGHGDGMEESGYGLGVSEEHRHILAAELADVRDLFHPQALPPPELAFLCALRAGTGGGTEALAPAARDELLRSAEEAAAELQAELNAAGRTEDRWYKDRHVGGPGGVDGPDAPALVAAAVAAQEAAAALAEARAPAVPARWRKRRGWPALVAQQGRGCCGLTVVGGHVTRLALSANNMEGVLPPGLGALARMVELRLDRNTLPGVLPADLGGCVALTHLDLSRCGLGTACQSSLPASIGCLTALRSLSLCENNLRGEVPAELGRCTALTELDLSFNNFFGPFPKALGHQLTALVELRAFGNGFDGLVPSTLGGLSELVHLDLSDNAFRGRAPHDALVAGCRKLRRVILHSNYLKATEYSARVLAERLPAANCVEVQIEPRQFTKVASAEVEPEDNEEEEAAAAAVAAALGMPLLAAAAGDEGGGREEAAAGAAEPPSQKVGVA